MKPVREQTRDNKSDSRDSMRGRNVLIVGKNSYIGEFLSNYLIAKGASVSSVRSSDCNFLELDRVQKLFKNLGEKPLTILFLAVVNKDVRNSYSAFLDNVSMAWNMVCSVRDVTVESLIYFSSVDVYGKSPPLPMTEETPLNPDTWYGLSKSTSEWIVRNELSSKCPTCILRIPGIFGHSRKDRSVIGRLISSIRQEGKVYLDGNGTILRDYVFATDLCRVVERLVVNKVNGTFNLATGTSVSLLQILEAIREVLRVDFDVVHRPANLERSFDMRYDTARLSAALGEFDFSTLSAGIRSYCDS